MILSCVKVDARGAYKGAVRGNPLTIYDKLLFVNIGVLIASFGFRFRTFICGVTILSSHLYQSYWKPMTQSSSFIALIAWLISVSLLMETSLVMALYLPLNSWCSWSCYCVHDVLLGKPSTSRTPLSCVISRNSIIERLAFRCPFPESVLRITGPQINVSVSFRTVTLWQLGYKGK